MDDYVDRKMDVAHGLAQDEEFGKMRESASLVLKHSTAYPFKVSKDTHIQCFFCPDLFEEPDEFRRHVDCVHYGIDRSCAFDDIACVRIDITDLRCRICATSHDTLASVAEHLASQHDLEIDTTINLNLLPIKLEKDSLVCGTCGTVFTCHRTLSEHLYVHSLGLICHVCGKQFQTKGGLKTHTDEKHLLTFKCIQCKQKFVTTDERIQHVRENKSCWPYRCGQCKERFMFWEAKQMHLEQVHGQEKLTFPCKECGQVFEKRIQLYFHFKKTHTDDLKCNICGQTFHQKRDLVHHESSHTGERPYKCEHCDGTFANSKNYTAHIKRHDDSMKISCPGCGKLFVERAKLKLHMNKHHPQIFEEWMVKKK